MNFVWQLQEAKNKFSEVVEKALHHGPQTITRRGQRTVVVVSAVEYDKLADRTKSLVSFLQESPLSGVELDAERSKNQPREVDL